MTAVAIAARGYASRNLSESDMRACLIAPTALAQEATG